jgi:hypothetical protein
MMAFISKVDSALIKIVFKLMGKFVVFASMDLNWKVEVVLIVLVTFLALFLAMALILP